jgi:replicative DNA helicase
MKDKMTVLNVIGCLLKKPEFLKDEGYILNVEDFPERFHKIVFASIKNLVDSGVNKITSIEVDSFISKYTKQYKIFTDNDGIDFLEEAKKLANVSNFDFYYNRLKKISLVNELKESGFDTSEIFDDNQVDIILREEMQGKFDEMTLEDILNIYEGKFIKLREAYSSSSDIVNVQAGSGLLGLKEEYKLVPEMGMPCGSKFLNTIQRGLRLKKFYLRSSPSGVGKAISNTTKILTASGWKTVGEVKVGEYLFGKDGDLTKVIKVHPQKELKDVYIVKLKDGREIECCEDHLWSFVRKTKKRDYNEVASTKEIIKLSESIGGFKNSKIGNMFFLPKNEAVRFPTKKFSTDPYTMGAILGGASFLFDKSDKTLRLNSKDPFVVKKIAELENLLHVRGNEGKNNWFFEHKDGKHKNVWVQDFLQDFEELWNVKSGEKYIPYSLLSSSIDQRFRLLNGLMDIGGFIEERGKVIYSTSSIRMKDSILELLRGLGFSASCSETKSRYVEGSINYTIRVQATLEEKMQLFSSDNKKEELVDLIIFSKRVVDKSLVAIVDIVKTDKKAEMTCFTVDNEDSLFLVGDFVVTHNTRLAVDDICTLSVAHYYDWKLNKWIETGISEPSLFITTELEKDEIQTLILARVSGVGEEKILDGKYSDEEEKVIDEAIEIISKSPLWIEEQPSFSIQDIENCIKRNKIEHNIGYVFFDYIFMSIKMLTELGTKAKGVKLREDNVLYMFSDKMKEICNRLNIHINSSSQLNGEWEKARDANQNMLRGAKAIKIVVAL